MMARVRHRAASTSSVMVWCCVRRRRRRVVVVTTREKGKNDALQRSIAERIGRRCVQDTDKRQERGEEEGEEERDEVSVVEIPVLRAVRLDHGCARMKALVERSADDASLVYDWIIVTSPEGANVLAEVFPGNGGRKGAESTGTSSSPRSTEPAMLLPAIAVVGAATARSLENTSAGALRAAFEPSKALGSVLASELPPRAPDNVHGRVRRRRGDEEMKRASRVLYCASRRAGNGIEEGLAARGFHVDRANTYTVDAVESLDLSPLAASSDADDVMPPPKVILAFASPSAVRCVLLPPILHPHLFTRICRLPCTLIPVPGAVCMPCRPRPITRLDVSEMSSAAVSLVTSTESDTHVCVHTRTSSPSPCMCVCVSVYDTMDIEFEQRYPDAHMCSMWLQLTSTVDARELVACCIGETTAAYCTERGFGHVYYSDQPGVDGWAAAVERAVSYHLNRPP